jgi:hypothetical protein
MLTKLQTFASLYRELGLRWAAFRLAYALRLRTGLIRLQMPVGDWSDYKNLISDKPVGRVRATFFPSVSSSAELPENISWDKQKAIDEANRILSGELKYFSHQFIKTGFPPPNWHHDYVTDINIDSYKHWSQISDDANVDIKFIWEPNRFSFVYTLVRAYVASRNEIYSDAFWALVYFWDKYNFPNWGPNWMDGQEIALRLMAWTFGYNAFINSPSTTPQRKEQFTLYVAAQAERIYKNIGYAISTRSNHTISEAFGLWLVGLLFPELKDSEKYLSLGRKLLEQEAAAQIFPDGSYSMYSINYHRFILHIYLYAIRLSELNNSPFSNSLYSSISTSIDFLSQLINPQTGEMPVYGSNDGALVLPLNNCDFTDYRPLLQLGSFITKGERLFDPGEWDEDIFWLCGEQFTAKSVKENLELGALSVLRGNSFPNGGIYILRGSNSKAIIRCTDFRSRPSHADQLHVDLWIHGQNIACDAGTYLYSGESLWRNGLAHTSVHNTVTVDGKDEMTMVSRFTWTDWSKGKVLQHNEKIWLGEHDGYKPVSHKRTMMMLDNDRWLVIDNLVAKESHHYALHWLLCDGEYGVQKLASANGLWLIPVNIDSKLSDSKFIVQMGLVEGKGNFSLIRAEPTSTRGWRSRYYGHKEPAISVILEANQPQVTFWSFFGFENDIVEVEGNSLRINSNKILLFE